VDKILIVGDGDFQVGRYLLSRHFGLELALPPSAGGVGRGSLSVLSSAAPKADRRAYSAQLSGRAESCFQSGRVPLYTCFCGELTCGAYTVRVAFSAATVVWSEFDIDSTIDDEVPAPEIVRRTGPFSFERSAYLDAVGRFL